ncbi:MAG: UMP kinase [archaeon]|nr:UMP kinase [archaeon]
MFDMFSQEAPSYQANSNSSSRGDTFVISVGGSLLVKEGPDAQKISEFAQVISSLHSSGKRIVLVVGGGRIARDYVEALGVFGANNFEKDMIGIKVTRLNALLVANSLEKAHKEVLEDIGRAKEILDAGKIPVYGGLVPLFTTDAVGALLAEFLGATFVNLTNVDGIYDSNPRDNPDAKRFDKIGYSRLVSLISANVSVPGQNVVLDLPCCLVLQRSKIPAAVLDGNDLSNFSSFVNGSSFIGTEIGDFEDFVPEDSVDEEPKAVKKRKIKKPKNVRGKKEYDDSFSVADVDRMKL